MQLFAFLALALSTSASPIHSALLHNNDTSSRISARSCTPGALVCGGLHQYALCGIYGQLIFQPVAAGTVCKDSEIVAATQAGGLAPAPKPHPKPHPTPEPKPKPKPSPTHAPHPMHTGSYHMFTGDGSVGKGWPAQSSWASWDSLWKANLPSLSGSCTQFGTANNSPQENAHLQAAIFKVAKSSGVDARMILATIMQESKGCVRVWTTKYSVANPGLMQSHSGTGSCNTGISSGGPPTTPGVISNPCPVDKITQMVHDGVLGTSSGAGLKALMAQAHNHGVDRYYRAARLYNSGSITDDNLSSPQSVATKCYASDVANRLLGFTGTTRCTLDSTG